MREHEKVAKEIERQREGKIKRTERAEKRTYELGMQ